MMIKILLILAAVIILIGILRLIFSPTPTSLWDAVMEMFLIDWMGDLLELVIGLIVNLFDDDNDWD